MEGLFIDFNIEPDGDLSYERVTGKIKERIAELSAFLIKHEFEHSFLSNGHYDQRNHYTSYEVRVKCYWTDRLESVKRHLFGVKNITFAEYPVCCAHNCWERVAGENIEKQDCLLFDRYGEEIHDVHKYCCVHLIPSAHVILRTVETINDTPDEKICWTKINVWRMRKHWYAQRLEQYMDGDYESGYHPCIESTPWIGPHKEKEAAIDAARSA